MRSGIRHGQLTPATIYIVTWRSKRAKHWRVAGSEVFASPIVAADRALMYERDGYLARVVTYERKAGG